MAKFKPLSTHLLRSCCNPTHFDFETTNDLHDLDTFIDQERAIEALDLGLSIKKPGYNIYALGPHGLGKHTRIKKILNEAALHKCPDYDYCYVHNFANANKPIALEFPAGTGIIFKESIHELSEKLFELKDQDSIKDTGIVFIKEKIKSLKNTYSGKDKITSYLSHLEKDILNNLDIFSPDSKKDNSLFIRYQVNLIIDHSQSNSLPVIYEPNPIYPNLIGIIEYNSQQNESSTNFMMIKPGALHHANGGYLLLDANTLVSDSQSWDALKIILLINEIKLSSLEQSMGLSSGPSLEPEPIPLDIKIILIGSRSLHTHLFDNDDGFNQFFKISVEFEDEVIRDRENEIKFARLIATLARQEKLYPFHKSAVAAIIEENSRFIGDAERLYPHIRSLMDMLCESHYWADQANRKIVREKDVYKMINSKMRRVDQLRDKIYSEIERDLILIDTESTLVGQINGISAIQIGEQHFGQPSRITAVAGAGDDELVDIEREVDLGGDSHSKGILILSGFIHGHYAKNHSLSLYASIVFEQNYAQIDGDSASMAELCALLSAIADVPIKQSLAITGSVDQYGQAQSVGSINEKIEGFFDICKVRGLNYENGVLLPDSNVKQLMLRKDVVEACENDLFSIYAINDVFEAMSLLTELDTQELNEKIEARFKKFSSKDEKDDDESDD